ncbi:MAG: winged helix-turn-helix domain-containing protein, partial [Synergistaceae bacterium]|nr:winged helix-turn-helix domain-containing protein [Synergistaceae bacterium]
MPMPDTQEIRKPLLEAFRGEAPHNFINSEILELIAEYFSINLNDLSSGEKNILKSGINYAKADLKKNGLIYNPSGNTYMITNAGTKVLEDNPEIITDEYLRARKKKPLPVAETFGLEVSKPETETVPTISEPEPVTMPEASPILEAEAKSEITELEPESETLPEDVPTLETEIEPEITELESEAETLLEESPIPETETEPETPEIESEPETLPEDA